MTRVKNYKLHELSCSVFSSGSVEKLCNFSMTVGIKTKRK